jgi:hypothetical protein
VAVFFTGAASGFIQPMKKIVMSRFLLLPLGIHLLFTALYAARFAEWGPVNPLNNFSFAWGEYTGSSNVYGFFAPRIGEQTTVIYTLVDSLANQRVCQVEGHSPEFKNRINTIYNFLSLEESYAVLCKSFAIQMFKQHPEAMVVRVHIVRQAMPTMEQYQAGQKIQWQTIFFKDYARTNNGNASI